MAEQRAMEAWLRSDSATRPGPGPGVAAPEPEPAAGKGGWRQRMGEAKVQARQAVAAAKQRAAATKQRVASYTMDQVQQLGLVAVELMFEGDGPLGLHFEAQGPRSDGPQNPH